MSLTDFQVVHRHSEPLDRVLIHCFDGPQLVLVFIEREAIDDYFRRTGLLPSQRNLLMDRNLDLLVPVIQEMYEAGGVCTYADPYSGRSYPQIDLTLADLGRTPEKMTDSVLDMAARASFQRA